MMRTLSGRIRAARTGAWRAAGRLTAGLATLAVSGAALADWEVNLPRGVTPISKEVYGLHMLIFGICVVIAVVVFGAMIYSIMKHRKSAGATAAQFHHNTRAEIIWTIVPFLILIGMAIPSAKSLVKIEDTRSPAVSVKVTGYQWRWHYEYLDEGFGFYSSISAASNNAARLDSGIDPEQVDHYLRDVDNPLVVPVGQKVRLLLTASDVIHAWWVPELAVKKDTIPGFVNESWFQVDEAGTFRGQCAELCGAGHGYMPIVVVALPEAEYRAWAAEQKQALAGDAAGGESEPVAHSPAESDDLTAAR